MTVRRRATKHKAIPAKRSRPEPASDVVAVVRAMLVEDLERCRGGKGLDGKALSPTQHRLLRGQLVGYLERLGKITGETAQMPEAKIVRLPAFRRVATEIVAVLADWPAALTAVVAQLERIERGEPAERTGT